MKDKNITRYRIKRHSFYSIFDRDTGEPRYFYTIEYCWLKIWFLEFWTEKYNFSPISSKSEFDTVKEAKEVLTKYDTYIKGLKKDKTIVETIKL